MKHNPNLASTFGATHLFTIFLTVLFLGLTGCSNQYAEDTAKQAGIVEQRLTELGQKIDGNSLSNVSLIKTYAEQLANQRPEFEEVAMQLRQDGTTKGPLYQGLRKRLSDVNRAPSNKREFADAYQELEALEAGSDPLVYNDALLDVVNTLADLSQGQLPRINVPQNAQTAAVKGGEVPGSYLVGNPAYGQWSTDSSGNSFWEWYGKYRMFTDVLGFLGGGFYRGPIYQDAWYGRSRYSFYHDVGRNSYGSRVDRSAWTKSRERLSRQGVRTPKPKNYGSVAGKKRRSTYAYRRASTSSALRSGRTSTVTSRDTKRRSSFFGASGRGTNTRYRRGK